jgi:hypothetical protein
MYCGPTIYTRRVWGALIYIAAHHTATRRNECLPLSMINYIAFKMADSPLRIGQWRHSEPLSPAGRWAIGRGFNGLTELRFAVPNWAICGRRIELSLRRDDFKRFRRLHVKRDCSKLSLNSTFVALSRKLQKHPYAVRINAMQWIGLYNNTSCTCI